MTDAKDSNVLGTRQIEFEWKTYSRILNDNNVLKKLAWLDVRGNHGYYYYIYIKYNF